MSNMLEPAAQASLDKLKAAAALAWRACFRSATMAWQYIVLGACVFVENLDTIAAQLGDPNVEDEIKKQLGDVSLHGIKLFAVVMGAISLITMAARLRSLVKPKLGA